MKRAKAKMGKCPACGEDFDFDGVPSAGHIFSVIGVPGHGRFKAEVVCPTKPAVWLSL